MSLSRLFVTRIYDTDHHTLIKQAMTAVSPADGEDLSVQFVTQADDEGGVAYIDKGAAAEERVEYMGINETTDTLVGVTRPDPQIHAIYSPILFGELEDLERLADGYLEGSERTVTGLPIGPHIWPHLPQTKRDRHNALELIVEVDDATEEILQIVSAPLGEPWSILSAETGRRYKQDETGIFYWDENDNVVIALDAVELAHLLVGTFQNALTGTRWEINSTSSNQMFGYVSGIDAPSFFSVSSGGGSPLIGRLFLEAPLSFGNNWAAMTLISKASSELRLEVNEQVLYSGFQARGYVSVRQPGAEVLATGSRGYGVEYAGVSKLENVPSSITFSAMPTGSNIGSAAAEANVASVSVENVTRRGFTFLVTPTATGAALRAAREYVTVGN